MKENSDRFRIKVLTLQKEFTWFECRYGEGAYCSICKRTGLQSERVRWISKPHNLLKNDKAVSFWKHHENSARRKENPNNTKMIEKWKRKRKETVRTQITEGNRNENKTERKIEGSLKSWQKAFILWHKNTRLPETTMKNWPALLLNILKKATSSIA